MLNRAYSMGATLTAQFEAAYSNEHKEIYFLYSYKQNEKFRIKGTCFDAQNRPNESLADEIIVLNGKNAIKSDLNGYQIYVGKLRFAPPNSKMVKSFQMECIVKGSMLFSTDSKYQAQTEYSLDSISSKPSVFLFHLCFKDNPAYAFSRRPPGAAIKPFFDQLMIFFTFLIEKNQINLLDSLFTCATTFAQMSTLTLHPKDLASTLSYVLQLCTSSRYNVYTSSVGLLCFVGYLVKLLTVKQTISISAEYFCGFSEHILDKVVTAHFIDFVKEMLDQNDYSLRQPLFEGTAALIVWNIQWGMTTWLGVLEFLSFNELVLTTQKFLIASPKTLKKEYYNRIFRAPLKPCHFTTIVYSCFAKPTRALLCFKKLIESGGGSYRLPFEFYSLVFCGFWEIVDIKKLTLKNHEALVSFFHQYPLLLKSFIEVPGRMKRLVEDSCHFGATFFKLVPLILDNSNSEETLDQVSKLFAGFLLNSIGKLKKQALLDYLDALKACELLSQNPKIQEIVSKRSATYIGHDLAVTESHVIEESLDEIAKRLSFISDDFFGAFIRDFLVESDVEIQIKARSFFHICKNYIKDRDSKKILSLFEVFLHVQAEDSLLSPEHKFGNIAFVIENPGLCEQDFVFLFDLFLNNSWNFRPEEIIEVCASLFQGKNKQTHQRTLWSFIDSQTPESFFNVISESIKKISIGSLTKFVDYLEEYINIVKKRAKNARESESLQERSSEICEEKKENPVSSQIEVLRINDKPLEPFTTFFLRIFETYCASIPQKEALGLLCSSIKHSKGVFLEFDVAPTPNQEAFCLIFMKQKEFLKEILHTTQVFWEVEVRLKSICLVGKFFEGVLGFLEELQLIESEESSEMLGLLGLYRNSMDLYLSLLKEFSNLRFQRTFDKKVFDQMDTLRYETLPKWSEFIQKDACFLETLITAFQDNTSLNEKHDKLLFQLACETDRSFDLEQKLKQLDREIKTSEQLVKELKLKIKNHEEKDREYRTEVTRGLQKSEQAEQLLRELREDLIKKETEITTYERIFREHEAEFRLCKEQMDKGANENNQLRAEMRAMAQRREELEALSKKQQGELGVFYGETEKIMMLSIPDLDKLENHLVGSIKKIQMVRATKEAASRYEAPKCKVCLTNDINVVLKPCNHIVLCTVCVQSIARTSNKCPMCRQAILSAEKAFFG